MKTIIIIALMLLYGSSLFAQNYEFNLGLSLGYNGYSFGILKKDAANIAKSLPDNKRFESYPAYWNYQGSIGFILNTYYSVNLIYTFCSTGADINYADYSGSYAFTNVIKAHFLGIENGLVLDIPNDVPIRVIPSFEFGKMITFMDINEKMEIFEDSRSNHQKIDYNEFYWGIGLNIIYKYDIFRFGLKFNIVNEIHELSFFNYQEQQMAKLTDWSGARIYFTASVNILESLGWEPEEVE
jgi:hypothetical protein